MRITVLGSAMIIRWAILNAADKDPRWSGWMALFWLVVLVIALAWDVYDTYQRAATTS